MTSAVRSRTWSYRAELIALTAAKTIANTALRWVGPFLPTLERAFSTTTGTLTGIMGVCELGGLSTVATGATLDRGHERTVFALGLTSSPAIASVREGPATAMVATPTPSVTSPISTERRAPMRSPNDATEVDEPSSTSPKPAATTPRPPVDTA